MSVCVVSNLNEIAKFKCSSCTHWPHKHSDNNGVMKSCPIFCAIERRWNVACEYIIVKRKCRKFKLTLTKLNLLWRGHTNEKEITSVFKCKTKLTHCCAKINQNIRTLTKFDENPQNSPKILSLLSPFFQKTILFCKKPKRAVIPNEVSVIPP